MREERWLWNPAAPNLDSRLRRITLDTSWTRCTDGSPAVIYVRPSTAPYSSPDRNRWVIAFEGGGAAFDSSPGGTLDSGMEARWRGQDAVDCKQKMSTDVIDAARGREGRDGLVDDEQPISIKFSDGIFDEDLNSSFAEWNWVYLNYCSSDHWAADDDGPIELYDVELIDDKGTRFNTADDTVQNGARFYFQGHNIVEEAVLRLWGNGIWVDYGDGGKTWINMEALADATEVLLIGDSVGGSGVQHHLDYFQDTFSDPVFGGAIGAGHSPSVGVSTDPWFLDDNPSDGLSDLEDGAARQWGQMVQINGFVDQSCKSSVPGGEEWKCLLLSSVEEYLDAKHLVRQDLTDHKKVPGLWSASDYRDGLEHDYADWDQRGGVSYFVPSFGSHEILFSPQYLTQTMVACDQTGFYTPPEIETLTYDEALHSFIVGNGGPRIYDGKRITSIFVDVIWRSWTTPASPCP